MVKFYVLCNLKVTYFAVIIPRNPFSRVFANECANMCRTVDI